MTTILELAQKVQRGEAPPPPIGRLLGFALKVIEPGRAVFEMEVGERHHNPMGTLHGGVYCDLADAAMGYAYASTLAEGEAFTTVELKINFLRAVMVIGAQNGFFRRFDESDLRTGVLAAVSASISEQHPCPQQRQARATIHLALDGLQ